MKYWCTHAKECTWAKIMTVWRPLNGCYSKVISIKFILLFSSIFLFSGVVFRVKAVDFTLETVQFWRFVDSRFKLQESSGKHSYYGIRPHRTLTDCDGFLLHSLRQRLVSIAVVLLSFPSVCMVLESVCLSTRFWNVQRKYFHGMSWNHGKRDRKNV